MKTKETINCSRTEMVCDLYAQVIWLRKEIERLERPTFCILADGQASEPRKPINCESREKRC